VCVCVYVCVCLSGDMIYEDVHREEMPQGAGNGWSSSEFESYDEQSDTESKLPTRSKVGEMAFCCVCMSVCLCACVSGLLCLCSMHKK
jgi:hypothetical protein